MTKESYQRLTGILRENPKRIRFVRLANQILTDFVFLFYPLFLLFLFAQEHPFLLRAIFVPAVSFLTVTVFRRAVNVPRPYERFDLPPILEKDSKGKSFPSRHVFSVFIIAMTVFVVYPAAGILLGLIGVVLGLIRIIGGVHEPRDIAAGALIGICSGIIGYFLM